MSGSVWANISRFFMFVICSDTDTAFDYSAALNYTNEDVDEPPNGRGRYVETSCSLGGPPEVVVMQRARTPKRAATTTAAATSSANNKTTASHRRAAAGRTDRVMSSPSTESHHDFDLSSLPAAEVAAASSSARPTRRLSEDETTSEPSDFRRHNVVSRPQDSSDDCALQYRFPSPASLPAEANRVVHRTSPEIRRTARDDAKTSNYDYAPVQTHAGEIQQLFLYESAPALSSDVETDAMISSNCRDPAHASLCSAQETHSYFHLVPRTSERSSPIMANLTPSQELHRFGGSWRTSERSRAEAADPSRSGASGAFISRGTDDPRLREQPRFAGSNLSGSSIVQQCTEDDIDVGFAGELFNSEGNTGSGIGRSAGTVLEHRRSPIVTSLQSTSSSSSLRRIESGRTPDIDAILSENLTLREANMQQANTICSLRKEIETLCRQLHSSSGDRGYAVGAATNVDDQTRLRIALLEEQIETFREDFHNERKDKERALAEKRSLIQQTTDLLNELRAAREKSADLQRALDQLAHINRH